MKDITLLDSKISKIKKIQFDKTNFNFKAQKMSKELLIEMKKKKIISDFYLNNNFCLINGECLTIMKELIKNNLIVDHIIVLISAFIFQISPLISLISILIFLISVSIKSDLLFTSFLKSLISVSIELNLVVINS